MHLGDTYHLLSDIVLQQAESECRHCVTLSVFSDILLSDILMPFRPPECLASIINIFLPTISQNVQINCSVTSCYTERSPIGIIEQFNGELTSLRGKGSQEIPIAFMLWNELVAHFAK